MKLLAAALFLALAAPASAAVPRALGPDGLVFPFAGGGRAEPRDGLPATRADLAFGTPFELRDGGIAFLEFTGSALAVGLDGRITMLPRLEGIRGMTDAPDGTLLAVTGTQVLELPTAATSWRLERALPRRFDPVAILPLSDGYAVIGKKQIMRVENGIVAVRPWRLIFGFYDAMPDGSVAVAWMHRDRIDTVAPDGTRRVVRDRARGGAEGFAVMRDGTFVRQRDKAIEVITPDGRIEATVKPEEHAGRLLAATADGALVLQTSRGIDLLAPPGDLRPLAAITPESFNLLASRRVAFTTTFAGLARVEVRLAGIVQTAAAADVGAGPAVLDLPVGLPQARFSVRLQVTARDGREVVVRQHIDTRTFLSIARARGIMRRRLLDAGDHVGLCGRNGARAVTCSVRREGYCIARLTVEQRGDGPAIVARRQLHRCPPFRRNRR